MLEKASSGSTPPAMQEIATQRSATISTRAAQSSRAGNGHGRHWHGTSVSSIPAHDLLPRLCHRTLQVRHQSCVWMIFAAKLFCHGVLQLEPAARCLELIALQACGGGGGGSGTGAAHQTGQERALCKRDPLQILSSPCLAAPASPLRPAAGTSADTPKAGPPGKQQAAPHPCWGMQKEEAEEKEQKTKPCWLAADEVHITAVTRSSPLRRL